MNNFSPFAVNVVVVEVEVEEDTVVVAVVVAAFVQALVDLLGPHTMLTMVKRKYGY